MCNALRLVSVEHIENKLRSMFPSGYPVLCTSGRAALFMALQESGVSRKDFVGVFPYANHCVLDAVARVTTPLAGEGSLNAGLRIVYHQWGYVQETGLRSNTIEDCVDTLCVPGAQLFPGGGHFEIWSLPKILGTTSGGVLWCRDEATARCIKQKMNEKGTGFWQWKLRLLIHIFPWVYDYWQGAEPAYRKPSRLQTGEIDAALNQWQQTVSSRIANIKKVLPYCADWLKEPVNRLPPVVPVIVDWSYEKIKSLGISSGYRMMEKMEADGSRSLVKVLPIPIHQDLPEEILQNFLNALHA